MKLYFICEIHDMDTGNMHIELFDYLDPRWVLGRKSQMTDVSDWTVGLF